MSAEAKDRIREKAFEIGFDAVGFASAEPSAQDGHLRRWLAEGRNGDMVWMNRGESRRRSVRDILPEARTVIVAAVNYGTAGDTAPGSGEGGLVARYARAGDYHKWMERMLEELAQAAQEACGPGTVCRAYVDTGPLLERELAARAGIGWQSKSTMTVSAEFGTWLLLGEVIVSAELEPDAPARDRCGTCTRCADACPTAAITGDYRLDARKCISYLTIELKGAIPREYRAAIGNRIFGCDDCLAVCPWNRFAREARAFRRHCRVELEQLDPVEILRMDESDFRSRFAGTPIKRLGLSRLKRNAAVVLGNTGDERALPALRAAVAGADAMVAEHAQWALEQRVRHGILEEKPAAA